MRQPHRIEKGFTLVEMLVVAPIVILAIGAFLTAIIGMTGEVLASRASNDLSFNVQDALNRIEQDVKLSNSFLATNSVLGANQGYNDDSTVFKNIGGSSGTSLILNMVATTSNPTSTSSSYVFLKNKPNDCSSAQNNIPFTYNVVYFVKNNTLFRRTLMPSNYNDTTNTVCILPWQQPSCSPTYMDSPTGGLTGSAFCKTKDIELVDGIGSSGFTVQYFNGENTTTVNSPASTTTIDADRAIALQPATTVGVTITSQKTAAGRNIERAAVLKVSRLDTNASSIATLTSDAIPASPTLSASTAPGASGTFSWPTVPSATGYTFQYNINGGAWQTSFTNQNTKSITVSANANQDIINARVLAINSFGSSSYATATVTTPLWESFDFQNNWSDYANTYASAQYTKTADGLVILKGMTKRTGTVVSGEAIANLPAGYRPQYKMSFQSETNPNIGSTIIIDTNGDIDASTSVDAGWVTMSDIKFLSATSSKTWTNLTMQNSWINRNQTGDPPLSYTVDGIGRFMIRGAISSGIASDGTIIANLPASAATSKYHHIAVRSGSGGDNLVSISNSQTLLAKGVAIGSAYFPNVMYFPDAYSGTWNNLTLSNSWVNFGGIYTTAQYTKSSDNVVTVRGLIKSGTVTSGTILATLPAGFRPAERHLLTGVCAGVNCRFDVLPDGTIRGMSGQSASWSSFDRISFLAEQ